MHAWLGKSWDTGGTSEVGPALLDFSLLDISFPPIDGDNHDIIDQVLGHILILEGNESKTSRLPSINILQNTCVNNFTVLLEMLFELFYSQLEVEAANKYFALGVLKRDFHPIISGLGLNDGIRIWFRDWRQSSHCGCSAKAWHSSHHGLRWLEAHRAWHLTLVIISRFDINSLVMNEVATLRILENYFILHLFRLFFIIKGHLNEAESSTSHGYFISHYNLVLHLAKL